MRTSGDVFGEIRAEIRAARARLDEVERVFDLDEGAALSARLLRMDAGRLVGLLDELGQVQRREAEGMLQSLRRCGDHTLDPDDKEDA